MSHRLLRAASAAVLLLSTLPAAAGQPDQFLRDLAMRSCTGCSRSAWGNINQLREQGPAGLNALLSLYDEGLAGTNADLTPEAIRRLRQAIDQAAGQRDAHASRLYWHTDWDQALARAKTEGKPLLSLRLLGQLTDEYSCANSRYFRTALYANQEIARLLREQYVLHWESVRPVPRVTIDFGDGRKLERTLTGNSVHYLLDSQGRVVDALPGLYGPGGFLAWLRQAGDLARSTSQLADPQRANLLAQHHQARLDALLSAWLTDLGRLNVSVAFVTSAPPAGGAGRAEVPAGEAAELAISKGAVEMPLLLAAFPEAARTLEAVTTDDLWNQLAALHAEEAQLDAGSRQLMQEHNPTALAAARTARTKRVIENPILKLVQQFQQSISLDAVRNEYLLHQQIHAWFARGEAAADLSALNERVYAELFLTPSSDPWLGLSPGAYTALHNDGLSVPE